MIPSVELQKALYNKLGKGSYPVTEVLPYEFGELPLITMSDLNKETNFTKTDANRFTFSVNVDGWSSSKSSLEIKEIEEYIYQTVMNLEMETYTVEFVNLEMNLNLKEEETMDRVVFHSIQQFEITVSKN